MYTFFPIILCYLDDVHQDKYKITGGVDPAKHIAMLYFVSVPGPKSTTNCIVIWYNADEKMLPSLSIILLHR